VLGVLAKVLDHTMNLFLPWVQADGRGWMGSPHLIEDPKNVVVTGAASPRGVRRGCDLFHSLGRTVSNHLSDGLFRDLITMTKVFLILGHKKTVSHGNLRITVLLPERRILLVYLDPEREGFRVGRSGTPGRNWSRKGDCRR
jgi:hypothetical protein